MQDSAIGQEISVTLSNNIMLLAEGRSLIPLQITGFKIISVVGYLFLFCMLKKTTVD